MSLHFMQGGAFTNSAGSARVFGQSGVPTILPPSMYFQQNGVFILGQATGATTVTFGATSGSTTVTFAGSTPLLGTASDNGRVITILDTTYKYFTITAFSSTTVATGTISGGTLSTTTPSASNVWLSGTTAANSNTTGSYSSLFYPSGGYANSWMYFPASSISTAGTGGANTAGFYYCTMQSSTVGQVYNVTLSTSTGQTPYIPTSPAVYSTTGAPGAFTQTTGTYFTAASASLPGNSMGPNGYVTVEAFRISTASATNKIATLFIGGGGYVFTTNTSTLTTGVVQYSVWNRGATNIQSSASAGLFNSGGNYGAVDTTQANVFSVGLQIAAATDSLAIEASSFKVWPSN